MQGSLQHLRQLEPMVHANQALLFDVLPAIYRHLPSEVPKAKQNSIPTLSNDDYEAVMAALILLSAGVSPETLRLERVFVSLMEHWPFLWKWLSFLLAEYVLNPKTVDDAKKENMHDMASHLLLPLTSREEFCRMLAKTPSLISTLSCMWKVEEGFDWSTSISCALFQVFLTDDHTCLSSTIFTTSLSNSRDEVADLIVRRLAHTITRPTIQGMVLRADIGLLDHITKAHQDLRNLLVAKRSIPVMTTVMSVLTSSNLSIQPAGSEPTRVCIHSCLSYLLLVFKDGGLCRINSALDGRLILSMFKGKDVLVSDSAKTRVTAVHLHDNYRLNSIYGEILQSITPYLIYRCVLREAVKTIKTVENSGLAKKIESVVPERGAFWQAWVAFKEFTEDRRKCKVETAGADGGWRVNMECNSPTVRFAFPFSSCL